MGTSMLVPAGKERIFGLDLLRSIAILTVLLDHGVYFTNRHLPALNNVLIFDGVDLFFVLSGFLIGQIVIRQYTQLTIYSSVVVISFLKRRWLRTLPAYYIVLCIGLFPLLIINPLVYNKPIFLENKLWVRYFFFCQNLYENHTSFFTVAWSLAVEEWFYISIVVVLFVLRKTVNNIISSKTILSIVLGSAVFMAPMFRYAHYCHNTPHDYATWDDAVRKVVMYRFDSILLGFIGAYWQSFYPTSWQKLIPIAFVTGCLSLVGLYWYTATMNYMTLSVFFYVFSFTISGIGIMLLLPYLSQFTLSSKPGWSKLITLTSTISYSIYLLHDFLILTFLKKIHKLHVDLFLDEKITDLLFFVAYIVFSFMGSVVLYTVIEKPFMAIRRREL